MFWTEMFPPEEGGPRPVPPPEGTEMFSPGVGTGRPEQLAAGRPEAHCRAPLIEHKQSVKIDPSLTITSKASICLCVYEAEEGIAAVVAFASRVLQ